MSLVGLNMDQGKMLSVLTAKHCGLMWTVGISTIYHRWVANVYAVQGDCETVYVTWRCRGAIFVFYLTEVEYIFDIGGNGGLVIHHPRIRYIYHKVYWNAKLIWMELSGGAMKKWIKVRISVSVWTRLVVLCFVISWLMYESYQCHVGLLQWHWGPGATLI